MLGRFSRGMQVTIPATFKSQNRLVEMDNVVVAIEYFNRDTNRVTRLLDETVMQKISTGEYRFMYDIPSTITPGNYTVRIKAKQAGSVSRLTEATDYFEIVESEVPIVLQVGQDQPAPPQQSQPEINTLTNYPNISKGSGLRVLEDVIVDVYNQPVPGVHITVYDKKTFVPNNPMNIKIGSAFTGEDGKFSISVLPGEYVIAVKGINKREYREFRKVQ